MKFEIIKSLGKYSPKYESDIFSVSDSKDGLFIFIETTDENETEIIMEVYFDYARGYRFLDEGDLIRYWKEADDFKTPYHIYEVAAGGWSNGETLDSGLLSVTTAIGFREWFIATTNGCITVLSNEEPKITIKNA